MTESLVGRQARYPPEGCHYLWFVPIRLLSISSPYTCSSAISPWQTKAAPNMFREYLFNGYRRIASEFKFWAVPFGVGTQHSRFMLNVSQLSKIILQAMLSTRGPRVTTTIRIARQVISRRGQRTTRALEIGNSHNLLILLDRSFLTLNFYQRVFQATLKVYIIFRISIISPYHFGNMPCVLFIPIPMHHETETSVCIIRCAGSKITVNVSLGFERVLKSLL